MTIRELKTDAEITGAFPVMRELRDRIRAEAFLSEVRRQRADGYRLIGAFESEKVVALAGIRRSHTLSRGEHLFVDDLITTADAQGKGHGTALLRWIATEARELRIERIYLDSRNTAKSYYERVGFTFLTSIPCWIEVGKLL